MLGSGRSGPLSRRVATPDLRIECPECNGARRFASLDSGERFAGITVTTLLYYRCTDCERRGKTFAVRLHFDSTAGCTATKIGELPAFGPKVPKAVLSIVGEHAPLMLKGRQAENQALGVGAYAYYRQIVERSKEKLLRRVREAAGRAEADSAVLEALDEAIKRQEFTASLDAVRFPPSLEVNGQNPLKLLHTATSRGLHKLSDEECLELAQDVRIVLVEMVRKLDVILADTRQVDQAVSRLLKATDESPADKGKE